MTYHVPGCTSTEVSVEETDGEAEVGSPTLPLLLRTRESAVGILRLERPARDFFENLIILRERSIIGAMFLATDQNTTNVARSRQHQAMNS